MEICILSGPIRTGKTTKLLELSATRHDVFGILTPEVNGRRVFMDAHTKKMFSMEAADVEEPVLNVGRYAFSHKAFDRATGILKNSLNEKHGWLIVDEIGPLELSGKGFYEVIKEILVSRTNLKLLLVIRDTLINEVTSFFELRKFGTVKTFSDTNFSPSS